MTLSGHEIAKSCSTRKKTFFLRKNIKTHGFASLALKREIKVIQVRFPKFILTLKSIFLQKLSYCLLFRTKALPSEWNSFNFWTWWTTLWCIQIHIEQLTSIWYIEILFLSILCFIKLVLRQATHTQLSIHFFEN